MDRPIILIVDDEAAILSSLKRALEEEYECLTALGAEAARELFPKNAIACVLSDQRMPGESGAELLAWVKKTSPDTSRILLTGYSDFDSLVSAVNEGGIHHFLPKPWEPLHLETVIRQGAEMFRLCRENQRLESELRKRNQVLERENLGLKAERIQESDSFQGMIGNSPALQVLKQRLQALLPTQSTVLITGESGTGKELCARAIHFNGPRKSKPFIAQNCAALPDSILESELFGHIKGAFTHATENRMGILEAAHEGTLFLDEVGDMSLGMQVRLLRFLQEGVVTPVGSRVERKVDVRVITATHRDLEKSVQEKTFREDLFYRLNIIPIQVPPLRERREDIPVLVRYFLESKAKKMKRTAPALSPSSLDLLQKHAFPGNIRELENAVEYALVLSADNATLLPEHLPDRIRKVTADTQNKMVISTPLEPNSDPLTAFVSGGNLDEAVANLERNWIQKALVETKGNISQTARILGLSRQGLHNKLTRFGMKAEE